jgi:hypothetical protein
MKELLASHVKNFCRADVEDALTAAYPHLNSKATDEELADAEVARLREALSAINAVPNRTATPLKKMRIMWDMAAAALDKEGT